MFNDFLSAELDSAFMKLGVDENQIIIFDTWLIWKIDHPAIHFRERQLEILTRKKQVANCLIEKFLIFPIQVQVESKNEWEPWAPAKMLLLNKGAFVHVLTVVVKILVRRLLHQGENQIGEAWIFLTYLSDKLDYFDRDLVNHFILG